MSSLAPALILLLGFSGSGCALPALLTRSSGQTGELVLVSGAEAAGAVSPGGGTVEYIFVHVEGAVSRPGVYRLLAGARACDALSLAGGETARACLSAVNLAAVLRDGQQVYVPTHDEVAAAGGGAVGGGQWIPPASGGRAAGPINVNLATAQALETLPGIGPVLASRIVAYREANGPFGSVEDLLMVSGIGPSRLADLRDKVVVQ